MIPDLKPLIEPLKTRFPAAWAKACAPHDDGEFNARAASVLYYEHFLRSVGRNGKRGNPKDLSRDAFYWKGEGNNTDAVTGGMGTIIDFIIGHESASASIGQIYPDPSGPGAWVKPLTLAEIDAGAPPVPGPQPPSTPTYPSYEALGGDSGGVAITRQLEADYKRAGRPGLDGDCGAWQQRVSYDFLVGICKTVQESITKHRKEWCDALGIPVL